MWLLLSLLMMLWLLMFLGSWLLLIVLLLFWVLMSGRLMLLLMRLRRKCDRWVIGWFVVRVFVRVVGCCWIIGILWCIFSIRMIVIFMFWIGCGVIVWWCWLIYW